jgi:exoribonuclease-2
VLKTTGWWSPHEDVALLRSGVPVMFTAEEEQGAAAVADTAIGTDLDADIRVDLTHLKVFTIDGAGAIQSGVMVLAQPGTGVEHAAAAPHRWIHSGQRALCITEQLKMLDG